MLLNGQTLYKPNTRLLVIPRDCGNIAFTFGPVDYETFDKVCARPSAPRIMRAGESTYSDNLNDPKYLEELREWSLKRFMYMVISSLSFTKELQFETVDISDPQTYSNLDSELKSAGFVEAEIARIYKTAIEANGLDDEAIEKAKQDFLAMKSADQKK